MKICDNLPFMDLIGIKLGHSDAGGKAFSSCPVRECDFEFFESALQ
jgi:hypothetical protein